jgi:hypothetical protein
VFRNKGFLYGLGLGLILGASLLQLMNFAVVTGKSISSNVITASPTIAPTSLSEAPMRPATTVKPTETTNNPDKPSSPITSTTAITKTEKPTSPTPVSNRADSSGIIVLIEKGMTSSEVANLLFSKGIISDHKAFDDSLGNLKLDRIIRVGTYTFLPNEKDEDIINKITIHK